MMLRALTLVFLTSPAIAQTSQPLPPNYKTILNNPDVLVQRVHYGPHESVPVHNHPAVATVYVYLNNSGIVDIAHEGGFTIRRPPTHTGAFRVSPGAFERHSIVNTSDLPSDFLRIELKRIPVKSLPAEFRGEAPTPPYHSGAETLYNDPALRVERVICASGEKCSAAAESAPSVVAVIPLNSTSEPKQNPVFWLPANKDGSAAGTQPFQGVDEPYELLRIVPLKH